MIRLKAGVVGAGAFGRHHARKYAEDGRVELVGVYDLDDERAAMLAETHHVRAFESVEALIEALDIVTIASPPSSHGAGARAALTAARHALVEKPLAVDLAEASHLVGLARDQNLVLACGHQERLVFDAMGLFFAPERPLRIESVREGPWTGRSADVSVTLDLMVHDLDLALTLMGAGPERVEAKARAAHGPAADDIEAALTFAGGAEARLRTSRIAEARARTMRLVYARGEVEVDFMARTFHNTTGFALDADFAETPAGRDPLGANVARFIDAVTGAAPRPAVTGAEGYEVLELALAVDAAAGFPSLS